MDGDVKSQQYPGSLARKNFLDIKTIVRMAKRLRLDLGKFGDFINVNSQEQELWENPLANFIVISYEKRFGRYK